MQSIFLTPLWLWKQSQKSSTLKENVDPEQGYNHAKFERYCLNSDQKKKGNFKVFFKWGTMSIIPLEHLWKSDSHDLTDVINNWTKFPLNQIGT